MKNLIKKLIARIVLAPFGIILIAILIAVTIPLKIIEIILKTISSTDPKLEKGVEKLSSEKLDLFERLENPENYREFAINAAKLTDYRGAGYWITWLKRYGDEETEHQDMVRRGLARLEKSHYEKKGEWDKVGEIEKQI